MVLGSPAMEGSARLTGIRHRAAAGAAVLVLALGAAAAGRADEAALGRALRALGAPSALWGRLAVEEESPDGPWTPLAGVAVTLYPYTAELAADLERIRDGARASGRDYDAAVARLQERLSAHASQVAAATGTAVPAAPRPEAPATPPAAGTARPPSSSGILSGIFGGSPAAKPGAAPAQATPPADGDATPAAEGLVRRATTDPSGLFLFKALPAGDWLVVAVHTSEYTAPRRPPSSQRAPSRSGRIHDGFIERERPQAREAEVWVIRARVTPTEPARVLLTDRSRFMVGPIR